MTKRLVCLLDPCLQEKQGRHFDIETIPDPSHQRERSYVVTKTSVCELTTVNLDPLSSDYCSWMVDHYIVQDGKLYTITPVDSLLWMLQPNIESNNSQWQPLEQVLTNVPTVVRERLNVNQMGHVLETLDMGGDTFYKFSIAKTLKWLQCKQQVVEKLLVKRYTNNHPSQDIANNGTGAFCQGFNLGGSSSENDAPTSNTSKQEATQARVATKAKGESIQIVCNYLSETWRFRFLESIHQEPSVLGKTKTDAASQTKKPKIDVVVDYTAMTMGNSSKLSSNETNSQSKPMTAGAKKLLKTSTKGMKKLSSFFQTKKKSSKQ